MVAAARGSPRDIAIILLMLHTGIRVSELIAIREPDLDLEHKTLTIHGIGSKERVYPLQKKALRALQAYLAVRPKTIDQHLFLNYHGEGLSTGRRKFVPSLCPSQGFAPCIRYGMHLRQPVLREERETISTGRLASDFLKSDIETAC